MYLTDLNVPMYPTYLKDILLHPTGVALLILFAVLALFAGRRLWPWWVPGVLAIPGACVIVFVREPPTMFGIDAEILLVIFVALAVVMYAAYVTARLSSAPRGPWSGHHRLDQSDMRERLAMMLGW